MKNLRPRLFTIVGFVFVLFLGIGCKKEQPSFINEDTTEEWVEYKEPKYKIVLETDYPYYFIICKSSENKVLVKENNKVNELYLFEYSGKKKFFRQELQTYNTFLKESFANANSYSLKTGCKEIGEYNLQPGDLIVQNRNGGIGHVSMIMDVCENKDGLKLFLIGYSFMPAQEFHIEHALYGYGYKGWFTLPGYYKFLEEKLPYGEPTLRRF